jgi:hypothetical protein
VLMVTTLGLAREHGFVMSPIDEADGRYVLTQVALDFGSGDAPGDIRDFFLRFKNAPPSLRAALHGVVPLTPARRFKLEGTTRLTPAALASMPKNRFVVGDRLARLNPVFGQGLGVGAELVSTLVTHLDRGVPDAPAWARTAEVEGLLRRACFWSSLEDRLHALPLAARPVVRAGTAAFFAVMRHSAWLHRRFLHKANMLP